MRKGLSAILRKGKEERRLNHFQLHQVEGVSRRPDHIDARIERRIGCCGQCRRREFQGRIRKLVFEMPRRKKRDEAASRAAETASALARQ